MASRQRAFAPSKVGFALGLSLVLHAGLLLLGIQARQSLHQDTPVSLDCRVEGPGLFLDLSPGKLRKKRAATGDEEIQASIPIHVEPLPAMSPGGNEVAPVVLRPPGSAGPSKPGSGGHPDGGGGASPSFFGVPVKGRRIVFVLDRSLSMGLGGAFRRARTELLRCLRALAKGASFQVVLYNRAAEALSGRGFLPVEEVAINRVEGVLTMTYPEGETDHGKAIGVALGLEPDAIFLVTDADDLTPAQVREITRINRRGIVLNTIDVSHRLRAAGMLEELARENGGRHVRAD